MSQENVDAVLASFDAWNRGDREGWTAPAHPEVEWSSAIAREVEGVESVYRGRLGLERFWKEWHALWDLGTENLETRDLGDKVLVFAQLRVKGKGSGVDLNRQVGYVFEFENGLVRRATAYLSPQEALEAVGLRE